MQGGEDLGGQFVRLDADRSWGHEFAHRLVGDGVVTLEGAHKVAMREDAGERAIRVRYDGGTAAGLRHGLQSLANGGRRRDVRQLLAATHDVAHAGEQGAAERAARVETGKVLGLKTARLEQGHGQGVAEHQHGGGAGGRGQVQRAGLLGDVDVQGDIRIPGQGGLLCARDGDDR